jgi:hypothetical protein
MNRHPLTVCVALALAALGCESTNRPVVPAEGKITFMDGTPLPTGTRLVLNPSEGRTGTASAATDAAGAFKLRHVSGVSGAEVGMYTIQLLAPEGDAGAFYKLVPKEYADGAVLTAEIKDGMSPLELKVARPKKK